jgi:hypothetical protein
MGASLLIIGGGVATSLVTTSCSNNDDKELGLTFNLEAYQTFLSNDDPTTIITYIVEGTVGGLKTNENCGLYTTKDGEEPNSNGSNV